MEIALNEKQPVFEVVSSWLRWNGMKPLIGRLFISAQGEQVYVWKFNKLNEKFIEYLSRKVNYQEKSLKLKLFKYLMELDGVSGGSW